MAGVRASQNEDLRCEFYKTFDRHKVRGTYALRLEVPFKQASCLVQA
jgi:hypothetical protein